MDALFNDLDSAIIFSLYIEQASYWGDELLGGKLGSELHKLKCSSLSNNTVELSKEYCLDALRWLKAEGHAEEINVAVEAVQPDKLKINCKIDNKREELNYALLP